MLKLEWNEEKNIIRLGNKEWTSPAYYKNGRQWVYEVLYANGVTPLDSRGYEGTKGEKQRLWNKAAGDALGCSYSVLYKHYKALVFKAFIGDEYPLIKKLTPYNKYRKNWDYNVLDRVKRNKDILWQTYNDGLYNLLPFVARYGKSPQEMKAALKADGQLSKWKIIASNSLNKNLLLTTTRDFTYSIGPTLQNIIVDTPTTLVKGCGALGQKESDYLKIHFKGQWKDRRKMVQEARLFCDTMEMAEREGEPFNPSWGPRRVREEHDRIVKLINARKYSPEPFKWLEHIKTKSYEYEGYTATLLDNALAIAEEGSAMQHCVGIYAEQVKAGRYLVYSVTKDGERSSTIGIVVSTANIQDIDIFAMKVSLQQHYGKYNKAVTDAHEKEIAYIIVDRLNKQTSALSYMKAA